jgi:hypothetical protein
MACATGFDEVAAIIDTAMGHPPEIKTLSASHHCLQYIIGAEQSGVLAGIECSKTFQDKIVHLYQHRQPDAERSGEKGGNEMKRSQIGIEEKIERQK